MIEGAPCADALWLIDQKNHSSPSISSSSSSLGIFLHFFYQNQEKKHLTLNILLNVEGQLNQLKCNQWLCQDQPPRHPDHSDTLVDLTIKVRRPLVATVNKRRKDVPQCTSDASSFEKTCKCSSFDVASLVYNRKLMISEMPLYCFRKSLRCPEEERPITILFQVKCGRQALIHYLLLYVVILFIILLLMLS